MLDNYILRGNARAQLKGNWGIPILVCFLNFLILFVISMIPFVGGLITAVLTGPFMVGIVMFSLKFKRGEKSGVTLLFEGFKYFGSTVGLYFWYCLWVFLWTLLLIIPGIIKAISYAMCYYIMADNPHIGIRNALNLSKKMTKGYKGKLFILQLSFIGWAILSLLTLGIGYLWLVPYIQITMANFYDDLKAASINNGICNANEF